MSSQDRVSSQDRGQPLARGFPAFPPVRGRGAPANTGWWVKGWSAAVAEFLLDQSLLTRGRRLARTGALGPITITAAAARATAYDRQDDLDHQVRVTVDPFTDHQWQRLLDQIASRSGLVAALLDGQLPRQLTIAAEAAGARLLPEGGDLGSDCTCPDGAWTCVHAVALAHQVGWVLAGEPLLTLLLRGRDPDRLLAALTDQPATGAGPDAARLAPLVARAAERAQALLATVPDPAAAQV